MKYWFRASLYLNLLLSATLLIAFYHWRGGKNQSRPLPQKTRDIKAVKRLAAQPLVNSLSSPAQPRRFTWKQLESSKSYRQYIANLRAVGCPEATIEDIVRGDTRRAFAYERQQLGLSGSGYGPWSRSRARQLVASLLGNPANEGAKSAATDYATIAPASPGTMNAGLPGSVSQPNTAAPAPTGSTGMAVAYPLFLQNVNWAHKGFSPIQQADILTVRDHFKRQLQLASTGAAANPNANASSSPAANSIGSPPWQAAVKSANAQLRGLLGAQAYNDYAQQQYYSWYQPQVAANGQGQSLNLNLPAFLSR